MVLYRASWLGFFPSCCCRAFCFAGIGCVLVFFPFQHLHITKAVGNSVLTLESLGNIAAEQVSWASGDKIIHPF